MKCALVLIGRAKTKWKRKRERMTRPGAHSFFPWGPLWKRHCDCVGQSLPACCSRKYSGGAASRLLRRQALEGCERWKPVVTLQKAGCRLKFCGEAGYIISGRVLLSGKVAVQGLSSHQQWARSLHQPIDSTGIGETAAKRKICADIFNDIPTRPPTLTIKKSTTTPLLHRKSRGTDIACHPE